MKKLVYVKTDVGLAINYENGSTIGDSSFCECAGCGMTIWVKEEVIEDNQAFCLECGGKLSSANLMKWMKKNN